MDWAEFDAALDIALDAQREVDRLRRSGSLSWDSPDFEDLDDMSRGGGMVTVLPMRDESYRSRELDRLREYERLHGISITVGRARAAVARAIADGILVRLPCEECGATPTDGHHDDYSSPLDVRWLCRSHHASWHHRNGPGKGGHEHLETRTWPDP